MTVHQGGHMETSQRFVEIVERTRTIHQGGHVESGQGFGDRPEIFRTIDLVGS
jgi:hypothetical protein